MESYYKCRFCFKSFFNGRALGGHMRSHMPSLHKFSIQEEEGERASQVNDETESDVSSSSMMDDDDPKVANESETESSRNITNPTRKRSKRTRKLETFATKKTKASQLGYKTEPECEPPHSSASDTTTDEDLAFCLMLLSRDKWMKKKNKASRNKEVVEEIETEASEGYTKSSKKGRFTCETCGKVFKSYQALGGHRASHKKNRVSNKTEQRSETEYPERIIHECPICLRVFASGQALGGHKRSHGIGNLSVDHHHQVRVESVKQRMIDLNLPAPTDEEEVSVVFQ
ncbi:PREDICTED: zinc finger protein ZAT9-like [Brassica oleracea var. oleracea]|uniref:C2H2-type domain-containing protein n=1 Tax=Brassica oleracea var. oleracea TaxID=109376 RepID=A0A0D3CV02_BRAOL|nr:PREDICTED: zinc finger protein ZAT9-like [Brassica oleracea var. oleracea]